MVSKQDAEDHADSDDVGDIRHEEDSLKESLKRFDRVDGQSNGQSDDDRYRDSDKSDEHCVGKGRRAVPREEIVVQSPHIVIRGDAEDVSVIEEGKAAAAPLRRIVVLQERNDKGVENGIESEKSHQQKDGR